MNRLANIGGNGRLKRRLVYHLFLGVACLGLTFLFMHLFPKRDLVYRLSIGTAYPALLLTSAALLLVPFHVLLRIPNPFSLDLLRDVVIWSGIAVVVSAAVGLNVHLLGRLW